MRKILNFILKCGAGFGLMYGAMYLLGKILVFAEQHFIGCCIVALPFLFWLCIKTIKEI